ncbi:MAG: hypothetical protein HW389_882 [Bacteroidetes bacterium]|nr:hypothetical protein [Bacteroidota bacterium]
MKKLFGGGTVFSSLIIPLALGSLFTVFSPSASQAQTGWEIVLNMPDTDVLMLSNYVGVDRKLKPVAGQSLTITAPNVTPAEVYLEATVMGANIKDLASCSGEIAWARTKKFFVTGQKTLGANDFTGGGIGIEISRESNCVDDLAKKVTEGVGSAPPGTYSLKLEVFYKDPKDPTGRIFTSGAIALKQIDIIASSVQEINLNLISPANGEQLSSSNPTFQFDAQKEGKIYVYEHSNSGQSSQDAVRPGGLKCLEFAYNFTGTNQVNYLYPGNALRPLQLGKKYSWFIEASVATGGGQSETRTSTVYSFTVSSNDPNYTRLLDALTNAPDPIGSTVSNLLSSGYTLAYSTSNYIKLKAGTSSTRLEISDLLQKLAELTQRGIQVTVSVGTE